jgi:putative aldouronate transport system permease protein
VRIRRSSGEVFFDLIVYAVISCVCLCTLYPFLYILAISLSEVKYVTLNEVFLLPKGLNFAAYEIVIQYKGIWQAYTNTLFYTAAGTLVSLTLTSLAAYPLSRKDWKLRKAATLMIALTLWFSGGIIPFYLVFKELNLLDTRASILLYSAVSAYLIIIMRSYIESLPKELEDSAKIDGANDIRIFTQIILPLSKPVLAVIGLYYAVAKWNSFFWERIFLSDINLMPLQVLLVRMIRDNTFSAEIQKSLMNRQEVMPITIQYAAIIVTVLPIIMVYPFLQKHFVKGVMIGAIKS